MILAAIGFFWWTSTGIPSMNPEVVRLAISRSGTKLAAATADGEISAWQLGDFRFLGSARNGSHPVNDLSFSVDEKWIGIAGRRLTLRRVDSLADSLVLRDDGANYGSVDFHPDGKRLVTIRGDGVIEVLEVPSRRAIASACCSTIAGAVAFRPDGTVVFSGGHWPRVWRSDNLTPLSRLTLDRQFMCFGPIAFSGGEVLIGSQDGRVHTWDARTFERKTGSPGSTDWVDTIAVQAETGIVAYAGANKNLRVWDRSTGRTNVLKEIRPSSNIVYCSGSGLLALGRSDGTIQFWDVQGVRLVSTLRIPVAGPT